MFTYCKDGQKTFVVKTPVVYMCADLNSWKTCIIIIIIIIIIRPRFISREG